MILVTKTYVCMYVCMYVYLLDCTQPRNPAQSSESFYATRIDPPKGGSMILVTKTSDQARQRGHTLSTCIIFIRALSTLYVYMYVCIFIKLHIAAQSGPAILVILCHLH